MNKFENYGRLENYFSECYKQLQVEEYDFCYIYSDLRAFASKLEFKLDKNDFCSSIMNPLLRLNQTLIIPTFTYTTDGIFDVNKTPTKLGALNSWILSQTGMKRSEHPMFSFGSLGPKSSIVENCGKSAFGHDSIHERLRNKKCCFLNIGRSLASGNTLVHNVEQSCGATYRYNKCLKTQVFKNKKFFGTDYTAFLRRLDIPNNDVKINFVTASKNIFDSGIVKSISLNPNTTIDHSTKNDSLLSIFLYDYDKTHQILVESFNKDISVFISKPFVQY
tara:strand:- start:1671 stop:2501 length:831 start_codon:yes stop_codon:yes gene_type:complete